MDYIKLKDACSINMGQSPDSSSYNESGEGIPFFQGNADFGEKHPVTRVWCNAPTKIAHAGDILISVRAPIGALNYAKEKCCIGRGLAAITPDNSKVSPEFIFWLLKGKNAELNCKGTGSTFKAIGRKVLEEIMIPDLGIERQQEYAAHLEKTYSIIHMRKQELSTLDDLIKARFVEMFGDIIINSKQWRIIQLGDVSSSRLGKMLDAKQQTGKHAFPYLANYNVQWFRFDLSDLREMDFNEADQKEFELQDGDLLITEGGEVGRCAIWHNEITPCFFQKALHRVRVNRDIIIPEYLAHWFKAHADYNAFDDVVGGQATIAHLPGVKLKQLQIVVPPMVLQQQFAGFVRQIDKTKAAVKKALDQEQLLFDSLIQRYFG